MDGDEWKRDAQREEWNSPANVWLREYSSFMELNYNTILRSVVQGGKQPLDKIAVKLTKQELESKLASPEFKEIPLPIQQAYTSFREYLLALETSTPDEIDASRKALEGVFRLGIACNTFGYSITGKEKSIYFRADPCRGTKMEARTALAHAEESGLSNVLEGARKMTDVCNNCPYRCV